MLTKKQIETLPLVSKEELSSVVDKAGHGCGPVMALRLARTALDALALREALIRRAHDVIIRDEKDGAVWAQLLADMAKEIDNG